MLSNFQVLLISFLMSGIGFLSQTLASGFWAATFSDDVVTFSFCISFFFLGMGAASLYSGKIVEPRSKLLIFAILSTLLLGALIPLLKWGIWIGLNHIIYPVTLVFIAGFFSGFAIPLALRSLEGTTGLGTLFLLDYFAAIFFSCLFTFVFLVPFGYQKTAGIVSVLIFILLFVLNIRHKVLSTRLCSVAIILAAMNAILFLLPFPKSKNVVLSKQTHYQKIVLTEAMDPVFPNRKTHHLYLDGFLQFSGEDEQIYHACLVNIPMAALSFMQGASKKVLVLGGGDGLAVRNVLENSIVEKVDLVELDPEMIRLAKENSILTKYNNKSLFNNKVQVITQDAFLWVKNRNEKYDVIVVDFPAPKNLTLARLFSLEFYAQVKELLKENGFIAIQAGPSYSFSDPESETISEVTASIEKTLKVLSLHTAVYATSKDSEAFVLAWKNASFNMNAFAKRAGLDQAEGVGTMCMYRENWKRPDSIAVNTLNTLPISRYMLDWFRKRQGSFFFYQGASAIFLPD